MLLADGQNPLSSQNSGSGVIEVRVQLFGMMRDFFDADFLVLNILGTAHASDVKAELARRLQEHRPHLGDLNQVRVLLSSTALADETRVLAGHDEIRNGMELAVLPPVCGG